MINYRRYHFIWIKVPSECGSGDYGSVHQAEPEGRGLVSWTSAIISTLTRYEGPICIFAHENIKNESCRLFIKLFINILIHLEIAPENCIFNQPCQRHSITVQMLAEITWHIPTRRKNYCDVWINNTFWNSTAIFQLVYLFYMFCGQIKLCLGKNHHSDSNELLSVRYTLHK